MICDSYGLVHLYLEASKLCFICLFSIIYCLEVGQGELGYQNKRSLYCLPCWASSGKLHYFLEFPHEEKFIN